MNVRDFLFNFVRPIEKICIVKYANDQILFYGKAQTLDRLEILNRMIATVSYDKESECLLIAVRTNFLSDTYHLPEYMDYVY